MAYLDLDGFKNLSVMPSSQIDQLESVASGWVTTQLGYWSSWIDSRLRKRYATPFDASNPPEAVKGWLARLVTIRCYLRRGTDPTDEQFDLVRQDCDDAKAEIEEAAASEDGLFDLPLRSDTTASGISKGGPLSYSEQSPYVWTDVQRDVASDEDQSGKGTGDG